MHTVTAHGGGELIATLQSIPRLQSRLSALPSPLRSAALEIGPLLLTYLFSEGTYVSIYDVSPLDGSPSAISIDSRPPLLASGAHSIGFRMVVCCLCIDLT